MNRKASGFVSIAAIFLLVLTLTGQICAQSSTYQVTIDQLLSNQYPSIEAYISVVDVQGFPMTNLEKEDFSVLLDGKETQDFTVSPYTNTDETLAIVLALDTSGSMKTAKVNEATPLENSIAAAKSFLNQLSEQDLVALVTFADDVIVQSDLTTDKNKIISILDMLEADGATAINDAIVETVDILKNRSERRAIVLLTDGKPDGEQVFTFDQAFSHASNYKIPIYPIGFGGVDENQLERLAKASGGSAQIKPDSLALESAFDSILAIFRQQYFLQINSDIEPDNLQHDLEITANLQGSTGTAKSKFLARKPMLVSIEMPADDEIVKGDSQVIVNVDALNNISQVDFYVDDELLQSINQPPFEFTWDTTQYITGQHTLKVAAADEFGFTDEASRKIIVELQRQDWIFWLIGLIVLAALAIFLSLGLRRKKSLPKAARKAILYEVEGLQVGKEWPLDQEETRLGRKAADNDIPLKGLTASRNHALIQRTREGYLISCLNSGNPLNINSKELERATFQEGDILKLGESTFRFEYRK